MYLKENNDNKEQNNYVERFHNPEFTAYDFTFVLSILFTTRDEYSFDRDKLIKFIHECKTNNAYQSSLTEINLKSNGITYYSNELNDAISSLKLGNILYTISPETDGTIYIHQNIPTIEILKRYNETYIQEVNDFIGELKEFEEQKNNSTHNPVLKKKIQEKNTNENYS